MSDINLGTITASVSLDLSKLTSGASAAKATVEGLASSLKTSLDSAEKATGKSVDKMLVNFKKGSDGFNKIENDLSGMAAKTTASVQKSLDEAAKAVEQRAVQMKQSFSALGSSMVSAGQGLLAAGAAITAGLGIAVHSGEEYNKTLINISANTQQTKQQTEEMRTIIESIGSKTAAPLNDIAQGYFHVSNFGFQAADATKILDVATKSAVATGANASTVAEVLAGTLHNFGFSAEYAGNMMAVLQTAAARANATLEQFASAAGPAFARAHQFGISVEETAGALETMTQHQVSASQAATFFEGALSHIANPTAATGKKLKELGLENSALAKDFSQAGLRARGFVGFLTDLGAAAKKAGIPAEDLANKLLRGALGGAGTALLVQNLKEYTKNVRELEDISKHATDGTWQFSEANNSPSGRIQILQNNFTILSRDIKNALLPALNPILDAVHSFVDWLKHLDSGIRDNIVRFAAFAGVGLLVGGALLSLAGSIIPVVTGFIAAGPAIGAVVGTLGTLALPITAVVAGIGLLVAAWVNDWGQIREVTAEFVNWLKPQIEGAINGAREIILSAWNEIRSSTKEVWPDVQEAIHSVLEFITGDFKAKVQLWQALFRDTFEPIKQSVKGAIEYISGVFQSGFALISGAFHLFADLFKGDWNKLFADIGHFTRLFWDGIDKMGKGFFNALTGSARAQLQLLANIFGVHLDHIRVNTQNIIAAIQLMFARFMQKIYEIVSVGLKLLSGDFRGAWQDFQRITGIGSANVIATVQGMVNRIIQSVASLPATLFGLGAAAWSNFQAGFSGAGSSSGGVTVAARAGASASIPRPSVPRPAATPGIGGGGGGKSGKGGKGDKDAQQSEDERKRDYEEYLNRMFELQHTEEENEIRHARQTVEALKIGAAERAKLLNLELNAIKDKYAEKRAELLKQAEQEREDREKEARERARDIQAETAAIGVTGFERQRLESRQKYEKSAQQHPEDTDLLFARHQAELTQITQEENAARIKSNNEAIQKFVEGWAKALEVAKRFTEEQRKEADKIEIEEEKRIDKQDKYEYDSGQITLQQYIDRLRQRAKAYQAWSEEWLKYSEEANRLEQKQQSDAQKKEDSRMKQRAESIKKFTDPVQNILTNAFTDLFEKGPKKFFADILTGFKNMLEQMLAELLAKAAIFGILDLFTGGGASQLLGGGGGGGIFGFLGFDDAHNDRIARHWGFDFGNHFLNGIADFQNSRISPVAASAGGGSQYMSVQIHIPQVHIDHPADVNRIADQIAYRTAEKLRGTRCGCGTR